MKELEIQISTKGLFGTIVDGELYCMDPNHLKCILRRDFIEAHGNIPGVNQQAAWIIQRAQKFGREEGKEERRFDVLWRLKT
jgi:hypothetical protein